MSQSTTSTADCPNSPTPSLSFQTVRVSRATFENDKLRGWVESHLPESGPVFDACAGASHSLFQRDDIHANDMAGEDVDSRVDVATLSGEFPPGSFSAVIYDPPYGPRLADRLYEVGSFPGYGTEVKRELEHLIEPGGVFIQLGFTGVSLPPNWGYRQQAVGIFNQLGTQRDIIGVACKHDESRDQHERTRPEPDWKSRQPIREQDVLVNGGRQEPAGGTTALDVTVHSPGQPISNPLSNDTVTGSLEKWLEGRTLFALWTDSFRDSKMGKYWAVRNAGPLDGVDLDAFASEKSPDSTIPITELSADDYTGLFDTIVFAPPESYFSRCLFDENGENQGSVDATAREAFDELLCPGGAVVQIGHTATAMKGSSGYRKEAVECFLPQHEFNTGREVTPRATFLTVSRKPGVRTPGGACNRPYYVPCEHCGDRFPADPRTYTRCCPKCGALPDQFCVTPAGDIRGYHSERVSMIRQDHPHKEPCPESPDGTHSLNPESWYNLPNSA